MSDASLISRADALQAEAAGVRDSLGALLDGLLGGMAPPMLTGSVVSGLMVWRDLDVMVLGGSGFGTAEMHALIGRALAVPGVTGFEYADERGARSPTGERRDERFHLAIRLGEWRIDLTVWLHDDHANVTEYHEWLRDTLTAEQRLTILRIKDVWHRRPEYPDEVGGFDVYTAVLEHGVRTPDEFGLWLRTRASRF